MRIFEFVYCLPSQTCPDPVNPILHTHVPWKHSAFTSQPLHASSFLSEIEIEIQNYKGQYGTIGSNLSANWLESGILALIHFQVISAYQAMFCGVLRYSKCTYGS